jgi:integrase/recombinase XerD
VRKQHVNVDAVREEAAHVFIYGSGPVTATLHGKFHVLRGFYRYLLSRGYVTHSPLPAQIPKEPERLIPYIYTREELQRVLQTAQKESHWCKLETHTLRALLLLLYGAGLRISEALRLTLADVDLDQRLLTIRETKFYKSRLVPFGPDLTQVLSVYLVAREGSTCQPISRATLCITLTSSLSFGSYPTRSSTHFRRRESGLTVFTPIRIRIHW